MAIDWQFILADTKGEELAELVNATNRSVTFRLMDKCEASFSISGHDEAAPLIKDLATDLYVVADGQRLGRFRIGATSETLDGTDHTLDVSAVDYRGMLERRYVQTKFTFTTETIPDSLWLLVGHTQTFGVAGDFGITRGQQMPDLTPLPVVDYVAPAGKSIAEALNDIGALAPGANWWIDAEPAFHVRNWRGALRGDFALAYGENVISVGREVDTTSYANVVRYSGADGVTAPFKTVSGLASRPEGRIEAQEGNTDLTKTTQLDKAATQWLAENATVLPTYSLVLVPDVWHPDRFFLGDTATVSIHSGRLDVDSLDRVYEIAVAIGDDGTEEVALTFDKYRLDFLKWIRKLPAQLQTINRR